jgi:threonine dehydratase
MPTPVHGAARRLRGHLIDTPLIGEVRIPGFTVAAGVRVKAECLQTAGSAWYRGYLHYMLRSLGRFKGIVLHGDDAMVLAQALAGVFHRLPMVAVCGAGQEDIAAEVEDLGIEVERAPEDASGAAQLRARRDGFHLLPDASDPVIAEGIATLGLELAAQLPADVARVVVGEPAFVAPIRAGFAAVDRPCEVLAVPLAPDPPDLPDLPADSGWSEWERGVRRGLRVVADAAGLAALWYERGSLSPSCVVL